MPVIARSGLLAVNWAYLPLVFSAIFFDLYRYFATRVNVLTSFGVTEDGAKGSGAWPSAQSAEAAIPITINDNLFIAYPLSSERSEAWQPYRAIIRARLLWFMIRPAVI